MDNVEELMLSEFSTVNYDATYIRYVRAGKMMEYYQGSLRLLVKLKKDAPAANPFASHTVMTQASIFFDEDVLSVIQGADAFVKNYYRSALFYA